MAKPRPHRPKGQSSGRPPSGHRRHTGSGPGGSGPRRPGGGPGAGAGAGGPRRRPAGAGAGKPGAHAQGQGGRPDRRKQHEGGPERRDRAAGPGPKAAPRKDRKAPTAERLQKVLASAGLGSRRGCEDLIRQGRVTIDGEVITEMGTRVEPGARVAVDGEPIRRESMVYFAVNKPEGYVSTNSDPSGRPRVVDLVPEIPQRVYTVGRLDEDSTGLIILTNDGDLANRLAHPKYGVEKLYRALVAGIAEPETLAKLTEGVWLSDGKVRAKRVRVVGRQGQATTLELVLAEGRKREIRRMLAKLGHKVMMLTRVAVGPVTLKGLPVGECRPLTRHEVELLQQVADGVRLSVPGFPDEPRSRAPRGPARGHREGAAAPRDRRRDQEGPAEAGGEHRRPRGDRHAEHRPRQAHGQGPGQGRGHGHGHKQGHGYGHGPARGPAQRPGGRPAGPRGAGGPHGGPRPMHRRAMELDLDEGPIEHGSGSAPARGPRGPRAGATGGGPPRPLGPRGAGGHAPKRHGGPHGGPRAGGPHGGPRAGGPRAGGPHGGPRAGGPHQGQDRPPRPAGPRAGAGNEGPAAAGGPGPRSRPPAPPRPRPAGPQAHRDDQEGPPRRRIIGLKPSHAAPGGAAGGRKRPPSRKPKPPRSVLGRPDRVRSKRPQPEGEGPGDE